jgi:hypothetical protein
MTLSGARRAPVVLLGAAGAGVLLWVAGAHVDRHTTGGYWAAYGLVALAGVVFGFAQLRGSGGHPPALILIGFLPVLIAGLWVLLALEPGADAASRHVRSWSGDLHLDGVVRAVGTWLGVLAFGIGATLAAAIEPFGRPHTAGPAFDPAAADEPTAAERTEIATPTRRRRSLVRRA